MLTQKWYFFLTVNGVMLSEEVPPFQTLAHSTMEQLFREKTINGTAELSMTLSSSMDIMWGFVVFKEYFQINWRPQRCSISTKWISDIGIIEEI